VDAVRVRVAKPIERTGPWISSTVARLVGDRVRSDRVADLERMRLDRSKCRTGTTCCYPHAVREKVWGTGRVHLETVLTVPRECFSQRPPRLRVVEDVEAVGPDQSVLNALTDRSGAIQKVDLVAGVS